MQFPILSPNFLTKSTLSTYQIFYKMTQNFSLLYRSSSYFIFNLPLLSTVDNAVSYIIVQFFDKIYFIYILNILYDHAIISTTLSILNSLLINLPLYYAFGNTVFYVIDQLFG